jgi:hypothetical protein
MICKVRSCLAFLRQMNTHKLRLPSILCLLLMSVTAAISQTPGNPENWCREGFFTRDSTEFDLVVAKDKRGSKAYFYRDNAKNCPLSVSCRTKAYVPRGGSIITNRTRGKFVCAWYIGDNGRSRVGWLRSADLGILMGIEGIGLKPWVGKWVYGANSIDLTIDPNGTSLIVSGKAVWKGLGHNVHTGEINDNVTPKDFEFVISEEGDGGGCRATAKKLLDYLIVTDNMKCGGANVTFSGVYYRVGD